MSANRFASQFTWSFPPSRTWRRRARLANFYKPGRAEKKVFAASKTFCYIVNQMVKYSPKMLNRTFAALADPTRRRILAHLARGDRCVTDLARPHARSLPAVSTHLRA